MPLDPKDDPSNPSSDYAAMAPDWTMIADIRAGARVVKMRGEAYLPRYENESHGSYRKRLEATPWRPEFVDALRNLCSKPFSKAVTIQGEPPQIIKDLAEDIDGEGNDLHSFARSTFVDGVADGMAGIYVTYPDAEPARTAADEKASGVRPYWVHLDAENILALYTVKVNGRDVVQHIRLRERSVERAGFAEIAYERVRVIEVTPAGPAWRLYEKHYDEATKETTWPMVGDGIITLPVIPVVLFFTGERSGVYRVKPPLLDLAVMQMEIYRALSREDEILTYAGSPMLKAKGMMPPQPEPQYDAGSQTGPSEWAVGRGTPGQPVSQITVGPKTILFAPPSDGTAQPDWDFIQPNAGNITAVSESVEGKIQHFRRLAMQPETHKSGNLTATAASIDSAKAHTAIEVWANGLKDVLEQAFVFTCQWLKIEENVQVSVHTDFGIDSEGTDEAANLITMQSNGSLSTKTLWEELQRRGILGPQFDADEEDNRIAEESPSDPSLEELGASLTPPAQKPGDPSLAP